MRTALRSTVLIAALLAVSPVLLAEGAEKTLNKTFEAKKNIELDLNMGDCQIKVSQDGKIHVDLSYSYECYFEPALTESTNKLLLKEIFKDEKRNGGYSHWIVSTPNGTSIDFRSATGKIHLEGTTDDVSGRTGTGAIEIINAKGTIELNTGTGVVSIVDSEGKIQVSTGSGKVSVRNSKGHLKANSGTGDISIEGVAPEGKCTFSSGTGKVNISNLAAGPSTVTVIPQKVSTK